MGSFCRPVAIAFLLLGCGSPSGQVVANTGAAGVAGALPAPRAGAGAEPPSVAGGGGGGGALPADGGAAGENAGAGGTSSDLDPEITGAVVVIDADAIMNDITTLSDFFTRNACTTVIAEARDWLAAEFEAIGGYEVSLDPFTLRDCSSSVTRHNVVAVKRGAHPDRVIVVGGHYDSISDDGTNARSPGANDSGSQTALVLAAARALSTLEFDATLVFVSFAAEEQGLVGSRAFASHYRDYLSAAAEIEAMINADMVGGDNTANDAADLQRYRIFSAGTPREGRTGLDGTTDDTSPARGLMRYVAECGGRYVPSMTPVPVLREDREGRGSDQTAFLEQGIPAVRVIETVEDFDHQHSEDDLPAYVTPEYTARITRIVTAVTASLARAPLAPSWTTSGTAATTTLSWAPGSSGPQVDHWVLVARSVNEAFYAERVVLPAEICSHSVSADALGMSEPEYYVSVAAVDAAGHASLFAYPEYRCDAGGCVVPSDALDVTALD